MAERGNKTRQYIIKTAGGVFSEKGFTAVTMKDICEACNLSRGGLYRHFASTKEIFIEVLERDSNDAEQTLDQAIALGLSAKRLIDGFFLLQKNDILSNKNRIEIAVYEFSICYPEQRDYLKKQLEEPIKIFAKLIEYGQRKGEFHDGNPTALAEHIVIFLEGLKLSSEIMTLSEDFLTEQFDILGKAVAKL